MQQVRRKERGFTIIELVVVILLLGILAAVALPRFINVTDRAYGSAVQGVYGGFATGVAMYRAQYVANGQRSPVVVENTSLPFDLTTGYPAIADAQACVTIWNSVLQSGRPSLANNNGTVSGGDVAPGDLTDAGDGTATGDFEVFYGAGDNSDPDNIIYPACYYVYTAQYGDQTGVAAAATDEREVSVIEYRENGRLELRLL